MEISESVAYLLKLIPYYNNIDSMNYIPSRLLKLVPVESPLNALFCRECVVLFIPIINSKIRIQGREMEILCTTCNKKYEYIIPLEEERLNVQEKYDFNDFFSV